MKFIGIIPARYQSSRFPGKPLIMIHGKSMIQRVYEQAMKVKEIAQVIIATDDERIETHAKQFGAKVVITSTQHTSGTDRCFEAIKKTGYDADAVINIQGDEPYIHPEQIDEVAKSFTNPSTQIATLAKAITNNEDLQNPNVVKVIMNKNNEAIYFSRHAIPFQKANSSEEWLSLYPYHKHIGIYGYRMDILEAITLLAPSSLERAESLEQLRWIENGYTIKVGLTQYESIAVDTPTDLENF